MLSTQCAGILWEITLKHTGGFLMIFAGYSLRNNETSAREIMNLLNGRHQFWSNSLSAVTVESTPSCYSRYLKLLDFSLDMNALIRLRS
jgi:hypothetical protein